MCVATTGPELTNKLEIMGRGRATYSPDISPTGFVPFLGPPAANDAITEPHKKTRATKHVCNALMLRRHATQVIDKNERLGSSRQPILFLF
jgi:hypothetical protein